MKRMTVFDDMNRLFEEMRHAMSEGRYDVGYGHDVPIRTETDEEGYLVHADLPGFERSEIDLYLDNGVVSIDATHEGSDDSDTWSRSVHEQLSVSGDVDIDRSTANYRNGVLEVRLPAENADDGPRHRIEIE